MTWRAISASPYAQTATDTIKSIVGDPIRRLGFAIASKTIRAIRGGSLLKLFGTQFQARLPFIVDEIWPGIQIYTESDLSLKGASDSLVGMFGSLTEVMAGNADPNENTLGRGFTENQHAAGVESPPPAPRVCMSIHPEGRSCSDLGSSGSVLNDPPARLHNRAKGYSREEKTIGVRDPHLNGAGDLPRNGFQTDRRRHPNRRFRDVHGSHHPRLRQARPVHDYAQYRGHR